MFTNKLKTILIACFFVSLNLSAGEFSYVVKKGETLSDILYQLNSNHIYGKRGHLKETLSLNPHLKKRQGIRIYPGEKIILPFSIDETYVVEKEKVPLIPALIETDRQVAEVSRPELVSQSEILPIQVEASKVDQEQYTFVRFAPQVSWMKALSTNSTPYQSSSVSALSKASPGMLGNFGINVSDNFNVQAFAYLSQVNFYQNENPNVKLSKYSFFRQAYGLGGEYKFSPDNRMSLRAGFFDEFFLTMNNTTTIDVETAQIPELHWGFRHVLYRYKNVTLDSGLFGKFIVPYSAGTINGKLGYGLGGDFLLLLKNKGLRFFYNYSDAKATNKSTRTFELGWNLVFEGRFYE